MCLEVNSGQTPNQNLLVQASGLCLFMPSFHEKHTYSCILSKIFTHFIHSKCIFKQICCIFAPAKQLRYNEFNKKFPSPLISFLPIIILICMLVATISTFGSDALNGGSQISLLVTTAVCIFIGMAFYRIPWKDYELAITNNISGLLQPLSFCSLSVH